MMEARTAATWRVEGVRRVAAGVASGEFYRPEAATRREQNPAPPDANRSERTLPIYRDFDYRLDEETGRIIVEVRDGLTGELVRQIPPEELLRVMRSVQEHLGIRVDRRA